MSRSVVAQGSFTSVERCDCGSVYLTVGPICMKLHPDALPELRETLARATRAFEREHRLMNFVESRPGEAATRERGEGRDGADDGGPGRSRGHTCDSN